MPANESNVPQVNEVPRTAGVVPPPAVEDNRTHGENALDRLVTELRKTGVELSFGQRIAVNSALHAAEPKHGDPAAGDPRASGSSVDKELTNVVAALGNSGVGPLSHEQRTAVSLALYAADFDRQNLARLAAARSQGRPAAVETAAAGIGATVLTAATRPDPEFAALVYERRATELRNTIKSNLRAVVNRGGLDKLGEEARTRFQDGFNLLNRQEQECLRQAGILRGQPGRLQAAHEGPAGTKRTVSELGGAVVADTADKRFRTEPTGLSIPAPQPGATGRDVGKRGSTALIETPAQPSRDAATMRIAALVEAPAQPPRDARTMRIAALVEAPAQQPPGGGAERSRRPSESGATNAHRASGPVPGVPISQAASSRTTVMPERTGSPAGGRPVVQRTSPSPSAAPTR